jgi:hypothetical protein
MLVSALMGKCFAERQGPLRRFATRSKLRPIPWKPTGWTRGSESTCELLWGRQTEANDDIT